MSDLYKATERASTELGIGLSLVGWRCETCHDVAAPGGEDSYGKFLTEHIGPLKSCKGMNVPLFVVEGLESKAKLRAHERAGAPS